MKLEQVITITGIRPDFIRMSEVFKKLDANFEHVMIHTGQHYNTELSQVFFEDLDIRKPDYTLSTGKASAHQYEQLSYLSTELPRLIKEKGLHPDMILFLGDSNSVLASLPLFKEGYRIGHIEGGMRSYDRRMFEEVNRVVCDYVSDQVFVYTPLYKERLLKENKPSEQIHVVGNTLVEVIRRFFPIESRGVRTKEYILADLHRNEILSDPAKFLYLLKFLSILSNEFGLPVKLVKFPRAEKLIKDHDLLNGLGGIELVGPYGFLEYLDLQYNAVGVVSDSGSCQEECPLIGVPVVVPRDFTERPESVNTGCSLLIGENKTFTRMINNTMQFFSNYKVEDVDIEWLGNGTTSQQIINILNEQYS
ncbi:MAG TPA: UDP-N-acetylglucosamine 2-epimerase [Bacteroidales bacterium]|nr:UDP-N-acetylglucosamine 2-epimerase [Bacteroidales bacterium]